MSAYRDNLSRNRRLGRILLLVYLALAFLAVLFVILRKYGYT